MVGTECNPAEVNTASEHYLLVLSHHRFGSAGANSQGLGWLLPWALDPTPLPKSGLCGGRGRDRGCKGRPFPPVGADSPLETHEEVKVVLSASCSHSEKIRAAIRSLIHGSVFQDAMCIRYWTVSYYLAFIQRAEPLCFVQMPKTANAVKEPTALERAGSYTVQLWKSIPKPPFATNGDHNYWVLGTVWEAQE